jgi:hypothetical protein
MIDTVEMDALARGLSATTAADVARLARSLRYRRAIAERGGRDALAAWHDALLTSVTACGMAFQDTRRVALAALPSRDLAALILDLGRELADAEAHGGPLTRVTAAILAELRGELRRRHAVVIAAPGTR